MSLDRTAEYLAGLVQELRKLRRETEWLEFKHNKAEPQDIGEYLSALANSAALLGKVNAYLIWGIDDTSHAIIGTRSQPASGKVREQTGGKGYASGFEGLVGFIMALVPTNEVFGPALRRALLRGARGLYPCRPLRPPAARQDEQGGPDPRLLPACLSQVGDA